MAALAGIGLWCRIPALPLERPTEHFFHIGDQKTDDTSTTDKATPLLLCFFSAAIVLVALSGGLYLIGIKGTIDQTRIGIAGFGEQLLAELLDKKPLRARNYRVYFVRRDSDQGRRRPGAEPVRTLY